MKKCPFTFNAQGGSHDNVNYECMEDDCMAWRTDTVRISAGDTISHSYCKLIDG